MVEWGWGRRRGSDPLYHMVQAVFKIYLKVCLSQFLVYDSPYPHFSEVYKTVFSFISCSI